MGDDFTPEALTGFKGWRKHFNTFTLRGRANTCILSFGIGIGYVVMKKLFGKKKTTETA